MSGWTFITNHGAVFLLISRAQLITAREIAAQIGITERSVMRIIRDLEQGGYIERRREGRRNVYTINEHAGLRQDIASHAMVGDLLELINTEQG
jgi:DNA-binding transcriptional ArsR family regulator